MAIQIPRGTRDILGEEIFVWQKIEEIIIEICNNYNIEEIRTPIFEHTELFLRGVGDTTDIVQKEMYTFLDKSERSISLRPEGTASIVRSYIENGFFVNKQPVKLFYTGAMFRYEAPQSGRYRQFHQFGIEYFGTENFAMDAEIISIGYLLLKKLGLENIIKINLNSIGGFECRKKYNSILIEFLKNNKKNLCPLCNERIEKNPLRVLDCKEKSCQKILENAPLPLENLDPECKKHFENVLNVLDNMKIPYIVNNKLVRGLDYYTRTVFELIYTNEEGNTLAIGGGGRYDNLVKELGGQETFGVGFAIGLERLVDLVIKYNIDLIKKPVCEIFVGSIGEDGFIKSQEIIFDLRSKSINAESDILGRSVKAQMKYANKINAQYSLIIGDDEIISNKVSIKNMETGEKFEIELNQIYNFLKK